MFASSGTSGARGIAYETRVCMLCIVRGYARNIKNFQLAYQVPEAGKFDDVVFDQGGEKYQLIQLKHKENHYQLKITHSELFKEKFNSDFNLLKYVKAVKDVNATIEFKDKVELAVVFTNIDFDIKNNNQLNLITNLRPNQKVWYNGVTSIKLDLLSLQDRAIFDTSNLFPDAKYYKFTNDPNIVQILARQAKTLVADVGILTESEIQNALKYIVYAVRQPNDKELECIIKYEIQEYFKVQNGDTIYNKLENVMRNWCDRKEPLESATYIQQNQKQQVISYNEADDLFQKYVKNISFGVTSPTRSFTGRVQELEMIREKLNETHDLVISQSLSISGLGGIGKTEIAKQFVKQFGETDFYGRVVWIESETDESIKKCFELFAQKLDIQNSTNKSTITLIDETFRYFEGLKVLFVFDNFDKSPSE